MDTFLKAAGIALLTTVLCLAIGKTEKDFSVLLAMMVCCILAVIAVSYLEPVLDFLWELNSLGELQSNVLEVLLKAVGIALTAELAGKICTDAGNGSLCKILQLLGTTAILYISIPVFRCLLTLIRDVLGEL